MDVCDVPQGVGLEGGATWSREDVILFMSRQLTLHRVSAKGGSPTPVTTLAEGETAHRWPWFLPDGQHFLYLVSRQQGLSSQVRVGSLDGRSTLVGAAESNAIYANGHLLFLTQRTIGRAAFRSQHAHGVGNAGSRHAPGDIA